VDKDLGGEICEVPVGIKVHCIACGRTLGSGEKCFIQDDSSSIFCLRCIPVQADRGTPVVEEESPPRPRRAQGRAAEWMAYE